MPIFPWAIIKIKLSSMTIMTQLLERKTEQRFVLNGVTWSDFKSIQGGLANSPGVRLNYYQGELELLSTSSEHEIVKGNLGYLLESYLLDIGVDFVATGSFSQEREATVSAQADESYCFGEPKLIPDVAVEVVITSGGLSKLKRYEALGVLEVWFWEDSQITIYALGDDGYTQVPNSAFVPELDVDQLARCAAIPSRREAVKAFRKRYP
jgi:Uma2 family endonuclease